MQGRHIRINPMFAGSLETHNPYKDLSNKELLEQLKALASYADVTPNGERLLGELYQRAATSFDKTPVPSKEQHGTEYLYTSVYKEGVYSHYFVPDLNTKTIIEGIFDKTHGDPKERIRLLVELGVVFRLLRTNEEGKQIGNELGASFLNLFGDNGFGEEPRHASLGLPAMVIACNLGQISTRHLLNLVVTRHTHKSNKVDTDQVRTYLKYNDILTPFLERHKKTEIDQQIFLNQFNAPGVQIHVFAKGEVDQVKIIGFHPNHPEEWAVKAISPYPERGIVFAEELQNFG